MTVTPRKRPVGLVGMVTLRVAVRPLLMVERSSVTGNEPDRTIARMVQLGTGTVDQPVRATAQGPARERSRLRG